MAISRNAGERISHQWYARPVLFVADLQGAIRFYVDMLGFEKGWHSGDGRGTVCQVNRGGREIILCEDAARQDKGRLFVELNRDGIDELRREISERSLPHRRRRMARVTGVGGVFLAAPSSGGPEDKAEDRGLTVRPSPGETASGSARASRPS
jgi:catechol 2,3-dioxygenase-like lactoylglutathione lyase family enzyme